MRERARAKDFERAIQWLENAGLIIQSYCVTRPDIPLIVYMEMNSFKMFTLFDCFRRLVLSAKVRYIYII